MLFSIGVGSGSIISFGFSLVAAEVSAMAPRKQFRILNWLGHNHVVSIKIYLIFTRTDWYRVS